MDKNKKLISFDHDIIGHKRILKLLENSIQMNRLSHAYLFVGPKHIGKTKVAREFVKKVLKSSGQVSKLHLKSHPDIYVISEDKIIKINQIRELRHRLNLKPVDSPYKICIIENAELMDKEAGNALLKTLEEPPGQAILILTAQNEKQLLPTLCSRCEILKFQVVSSDLIREALCMRGINPVQTEKIVEQSIGRPGLAIQACDHPETIKEYEQIEKDLEDIIRQNVVFRFNYINKISDDESLVKKILDVWLVFFRKAILARRIGKKVSMSYLFSQYSTGKIYEIMGRIAETKNLLKLNINLRLVLENLVLMF